MSPARCRVRTRAPKVLLVVALLLPACGGSGSGPVAGSVVWNEDEAPDRITMASAVFFEYPEPGAPDQLMVIITSVETDCDDAQDGVIDNGGWPKKHLLLVTSGNTAGTYEAAITGATGMTFEGSLTSVGEQIFDVQELMVISGAVQLDSIDGSVMQGSVDVEVGDATGVPPAGRLSGSFKAIGCGPYPTDL